MPTAAVNPVSIHPILNPLPIINIMKTTILGLLAAAAAAIEATVQRGASVTDWKTWILPVSIALLGYHAKDATHSGK